MVVASESNGSSSGSGSGNGSSSTSTGSAAIGSSDHVRGSPPYQDVDLSRYICGAVAVRLLYISCTFAVHCGTFCGSCEVHLWYIYGVFVLQAWNPPAAIVPVGRH